jgi:hypothetical protein
VQEVKSDSKKSKGKRNSMSPLEQSTPKQPSAVKSVKKLKTMNSPINAVSLKNERPVSSKKGKKANDSLNISKVEAAVNEEEEEASPKQKKTSKKKRSSLANGDEANVSSILSPNSNEAEKKTKASKDLRRKSLESGVLPSAQKETKTKRRKSMESGNTESSPKVSNEKVLQNGDVEIWIPNKKYLKKHSPKNDFANFEDLETPPPAFVKKALAKTEPKPKRKSMKLVSLFLRYPWL